jgi:hypothetical protein
VSGDAQIVYGRQAVAEAQRGRRRVRRVWSGDDVAAAALTRLAGSPDHQGIVDLADLLIQRQLVERLGLGLKLRL